MPCAFVAGCGTGLGHGAAGRTLFVAQCDDPYTDDTEATDIIVLEWDGGMSPIYPEVAFDGLDLSLFKTGKRSRLGDDAELFKELVRQEIVNIYCDAPGVNVHVRNAPVEAKADVTTVLLTQELQPDGGVDIGEAEYDPCNLQHDNSAVIFGEQIRDLGGTNTFDEWVRVFANVCAHEVGHALGFGHVDRGMWFAVERPLYVELMLEGHTFNEMRRIQRIIMDPTNCPDDTAATSRRVWATSLP